ncbi:MAG: hypothetical protein VW645_09025 [Betaproteobacteria bacterium]
MLTVKLERVAHCRSGDKGNTSNISVIAYRKELYESLKSQLNERQFQQHYAGVILGKVTRYSIDQLCALNFVCEGALGGGVSRSLCLDNYGKSLSSRILSFELVISAELEKYLK